MDTTLQTPLDPVLPTFPVMRFSAGQYLEMIRQGILTEDHKVELIDGVITAMAPAGDEHTWEVALLGERLAEARDTHFVFVAGTIPFGDTQVFDPDLALVRRCGPEQRKRYPTPEEIDLVIEVANSSLRKDKTKKAAAYAAAGVPEYWIFDIQGRVVLIHRTPEDGEYTEIAKRGLEETISPVALPNITVRVSEILGR